MCDSSFTVEKTTFVADIKQSITKVSKGISDYVKEKTGAAEDEDARIFMEIKGKKYDRELIETAQELTEKEEEIKLEGSKKLFLKMKDYGDYTDIEKRTVSYIRKEFKFTSEADKWLRTEIRRWGATRNKETKDPTGSELKRKTEVSAVFSNLKDAYSWDNLNNLGDKPKTPSQWAGVLLSIVFVLGILSGVAYGLKWSNQETQWDNDGLSAVQGVVRDDDNKGDFLMGVKVEGNKKNYTTNEQGQYYLYNLATNEIKLTFTKEGYGTVVVWMDIKAGKTNIIEDVQMTEGSEQTSYDYRESVAKPWPPNYALAPIFMIASIVALIGSSAALLHQNFRIAVLGCLFGVLSYGFLIGSVLSVVALSLLLVDRERFETQE